MMAKGHSKVLCWTHPLYRQNTRANSISPNGVGLPFSKNGNTSVLCKMRCDKRIIAEIEPVDVVEGVEAEQHKVDCRH